MTENADVDKYEYSGHGIGFDRRTSFSFPGNGFGQNVKDILVLGKDQYKDLNILYLQKKCIRLILLCEKKFFSLSLHYNGTNSYLLVNGTEIYKFKAKDSEIVASPLCLGNISKDWSTDNMKKTWL